MSDPLVLPLSLIFLVTAFLYASVGQAGGTGYLAAMALVGIAPGIMKPTALILNILVAAIASYRYTRASCFTWRLFWPFAVTSIPFAFLGGSLVLPTQVYRWIVGVVLIYAAVRLALHRPADPGKARRTVNVPLALAIGAGIGLLAGLTGVGGGIFLTPILLLLGWAEFGEVLGVSAVFILVNSISGLAGNLASVRLIPPAIPWFVAAAALGGWIGAGYGTRHLNSLTLQRILALVMLVGGVKIMFM